MSRKYFFVFLAIAAGAPAAHAATEEGSIPILEDADRIVLDGEIQESAWQQAANLPAFLRIQPYDQATQEQPGKIWILVSDSGLHIAARNPQPEETQIAQRRSRDQQTNADSLAFFIDPTGEGRYGYYFRFSLGDTLEDGSLTPERSISSEWDGAVEFRTRSNGDDWTLEAFIPWSAMRTGGAQNRRIGIYAERWISHLNESYAFPPISPTSEIFISRFHRMRLPPIVFDNRLSLMPYVAAGYDRITDELDSNAGLDIFWQPTGNTHVSATLNPDFGQVENDALVVNFTANETFYPEKRPFFLENNDIFRSFDPESPLIFYSRRVGAARSAPAGSDANDAALAPDIDGAAKLVSTGEANRYGLLLASEDDIEFATGSSAPATLEGKDFVVGRWLHEGTTSSGESSYSLGYLGTLASGPDEEATVSQVDGSWRLLDETILFNASLLHSDVRDNNTDQTIKGQGVHTKIQHRFSQEWLQDFRIYHFDDTLELNAAGFLENNDEQYFRYQLINIDSSGERFLDLQNEFRFYYIRTSNGIQLHRNFFYDGTVTLENLQRIEIFTGYRDDGFQIDLAPRDKYFRKEMTPYVNLNWGSDNSRSFVQDYSYTYFQEDLGGAAHGLSARFSYTPSATINTALSVSVQDREGRIRYVSGNEFISNDTQLLRISLNAGMTFANRHEFRLGTEWLGIQDTPDTRYLLDTTSHELAAIEELAGEPSTTRSNLVLQARYRYQFAPLSDLFIVYGRGGSVSTNEDIDPGRAARLAFEQADTDQLFVKIRHRF